MVREQPLVFLNKSIEHAGAASATVHIDAVGKSCEHCGVAVDPAWEAAPSTAAVPLEFADLCVGVPGAQSVFVIVSSYNP